LKSASKEICQTRVRYGYRRVHVLLRREGWEINMKKTHRIYTSLGLQLRNKTPKRRVKAKLRDDRSAASTSNDGRNSISSGRTRRRRLSMASIKAAATSTPDSMTYA
jgi:hypothetical protein